MSVKNHFQECLSVICSTSSGCVGKRNKNIHPLWHSHSRYRYFPRRIAFKDYEGRRDAAKKITEESKKIEKLFKKLAKATLEPEMQCSVLPTLAEVIKLRDTSMMALEISVSTSTKSNLRTTFFSIVNSTTGKFCSVAFIWMVTL